MNGDLGISASELLSWGLARTLHPEDCDRLLAARQQAITTRQPYQVRYRLLWADGTYYWMHEQATLSQDNHWQVTCTPQSYQQLQEQLAQVQQKLDFQVQQSPLGVIEWDLNFEATEWNTAAQAIFGYTKSEAIGHHAAGLIIPRSAKEEVERVWRSLLQQTGGTRHTNQNITKDGRTIVCQWYNQSLSDSKGNIVGVASLVEDITTQKQAEDKIYAANAELEQRVQKRTAQLEAADSLKDEILEREQAARLEAEANLHSLNRTLKALRESEERYRSLVVATAQIVWTTNAQGEVEDMPYWRAYTGQTPAEVKGWGWLEAIHPEDRDRTTQAWQVALETKSLYDTEYRIRASDGSYRYFAVRGVPVLAENNRIREWVGLCSDIQERKSAEAALTNRANELAYLSAVLAQTNTALEKRNQELDQFAYVTSHDLKAPLRAIANLSQWIEEDLSEVLTDDTRHQMNLLRGRVHRMEDLINGLLQFSRVGRVGTEKSLVSVGDLLSEIIDSFVPPAFKLDIAPMPTITTEKLPLEQVFSNLISNAVKHHPRQDGNIQISVREYQSYYEFSVADDGRGIDPAYHDKVFGIFQTLEARDKSENTGIGLAIVKKIVENQGGQIKLISQEGQGAIFSFTWLKQT
ncbi:PAS domain-containing sensor histidine kinase [Aliterella atlantica]|uniref:PAS domain-containing sensor histidine kinase n=1 Tax=Aliterella atlantica TaxID=1827278 RepID=UPI000696A04E|nr:PAS domain-containing protein [Aliterella atlantica]